MVAAGLLGTMLGSWIAYAVGRAGRLELFERHGERFHVGPTQIASADRWFARYGSWAVLFGRVIPVVRAFISLPAGVARMPLGRFSLLSRSSGRIPWVVGLVLAGEALGHNWKTARVAFEYVDYVIFALIVARDRLPDRAPPAGTPARHRCGGLSGRCRYDTRSPWACLQGPTELLPVSSSAHTTLLPWLAGWDYDELDDELRKGFEVALHGGTAAALALLAGRGAGRRRGPHLAFAAARAGARAGAPGARGAALGPRSSGASDGPRSIALALAAGSAAMLAAERDGTARPAGSRAAGPDRGARRRRRARRARARARPGRRADPRRVPQRGHDQRGPLAGLRPRGRAQAVVDRGAARDRGRGAAAGACGCAAGGCRRGVRPAMAAGAGAAFCSTLAGGRLLRGRLRECAADAVRLYRGALAGVVRAARVRTPVAGK